MGDATSATAVDPAGLAEMRGFLVVAGVSDNRVQLVGMPALISSVRVALASLVRPPEPAASKSKPLIPVRKRVDRRAHRQPESEAVEATPAEAPKKRGRANKAE